MIDTSSANINIDNISQLEEWRGKVTATSWIDALTRTKEDNVKASAANAALILSNDPLFSNVLRFNEMTQDVEQVGEIQTKNFTFKPDAVDDEITGDITIAVDDEHGVTFKPTLINAGLLHSAKQHRYNPVLDHLANCHKEWEAANKAAKSPEDKPAKLENIFIDCLGAADTEATRIMTRLFFDGLVSRAHRPGIQFDYMTILYSRDQGLGKSTLLRAIGGDWYLEGLPEKLQEKDTKLMVAQKWLVNDDELETTSNHKLNPLPTVKRFITARTDEYRAPYAAKPHPHKRRFVIAGTTNQRGLLYDATGSRRENIIECNGDKITRRVKDLTDHDIMLYLGEAEDRYQRGACVLSADDDQQELINEAKQSFQVVDTVTERVEMILNAPYPKNWWGQSREAQRHYIINMADGTENTLLGVEQLDKIAISWILDRGFNAVAGTANQKNLEPKIRIIMDAKPEWQSKNVRLGKFTPNPIRGYRRVV